MEPLSAPLQELLLELNICRRRDLRKCRGRVRQLCRDLPAFDSVWIDALLHQRVITPFQAQVLESPNPRDLAVGPYVLLSRVGGEGDTTTYAARPREGGPAVMLKVATLPEERRDAVLSDLRDFTEQQKARSGLPIGPHAALMHEGRLTLVSRKVAGFPLDELLVRRGRFPAEVVESIAKQLLHELAELESSEAMHGDVRLANIRLDARGRAVLVDAGVKPALEPELVIDAYRPPDRYEGTAPELIGTGEPATSQSDMYALGCVLWHLLAGRSPFPTGDSLSKLAAHQTQPVSDVREIAPDTPERLASLIEVLTRMDAKRRPPSLQAIFENWGRPTRADARRITRFRSQFDNIRRGGMEQEEHVTRPWLTAALMLFVLSGASFCLFDSGARNEILALPGRLEAYLDELTPAEENETPTESSKTETTASERKKLLPLPEPDRHGVVLLDESGPYEWRSISARDDLTIRTKQGRAVIVAKASEVNITANRVAFVNLDIRAGFNATASLNVVSQELHMHQCTFRPEPDQEMESSTGTNHVNWRTRRGLPQASTVVAVRDCAFYGGGSAIRMAGPPARVDCNNVLHVGGAAFLEIDETNRQRNTQAALNLTGMTSRNARAVILWKLPDKPSVNAVEVVANNCVFACKGARASLLKLVTAQPQREMLRAIALTGRDSLASPETPILAFSDPAADRFFAIDNGDAPTEGLLLTTCKFAGGPTIAPADSKLTSSTGPRRAGSRSPGVNVSRIP